MTARDSLFQCWKNTIERLSGEGPVSGKVAAICCQGFRVRRLIGKRDNAGVGHSGVEVGILIELRSARLSGSAVRGDDPAEIRGTQ